MHGAGRSDDRRGHPGRHLGRRGGHQAHQDGHHLDRQQRRGQGAGRRNRQGVHQLGRRCAVGSRRGAPVQAMMGATDLLLRGRRGHPDARCSPHRGEDRC